MQVRWHATNCLVRLSIVLFMRAAERWAARLRFRAFIQRYDFDIASPAAGVISHASAEAPPVVMVITASFTHVEDDATPWRLAGN